MAVAFNTGMGLNYYKRSDWSPTLEGLAEHGVPPVRAQRPRRRGRAVARCLAGEAAGLEEARRGEAATRALAAASAVAGADGVAAQQSAGF